MKCKSKIINKNLNIAENHLKSTTSTENKHEYDWKVPD